MQTTWDYTTLANSYLKRPDYSKHAIDQMCDLMGITPNSRICDVGAGAGHLTIELGKRGMHVNAVEPNDAMRQHGIERTHDYPQITWSKGTGEKTNQTDNQFDAVTFGSSFNVCDQQLALKETLRITKPGGWFACMWNHRDLHDTVQEKIENIICTNIPNYDYGNRRQDQMPFLQSTGLFETIKYIEGDVTHKQTIGECVEAWRSHGTLYRQANENNALFNKIINEIEKYLASLNVEFISIPYKTRIWVGKLKKK